METAFEQMRQADRAADLGRAEPTRSLDFEQIRQVARGTSDIILVRPKGPQSFDDLRELLERLRSVDDSNRWVVLPYAIHIEALSPEYLRRLGLQRIPPGQLA